MPAGMTDETFGKSFERKRNGCLEWTRAQDAYGYGTLRWASRYGRKHIKVHRMVWELANGPIPDGKAILHRCDNRLCGELTHLFLGTQADNQRDMSVKGRNHNSRKTRCPAGHEYTVANTHRYANGRRQCRICEAASQRAYQLRKKANS